jgi:ADP-ribose pyrophosphatase YjhB (NUDIX family)|tara:strand:- start:385 stop:822 length:438 start_codon:yes stop_codon:yes gene_type:complete
MDSEKDGQKCVCFPRVLGVVFNTETKKILIGKRRENETVEELTWAFPGSQAEVEEELEEAIKRGVKEKTGLDVESMGVIFAKKYSEKKDLIGIYFLCGVVGGEEMANGNFSELKWVAPNEVRDYFTTSFHPKLREYIEGLTNHNI